MLFGYEYFADGSKPNPNNTPSYNACIIYCFFGDLDHYWKKISYFFVYSQKFDKLLFAGHFSLFHSTLEMTRFNPNLFLIIYPTHSSYHLSPFQPQFVFFLRYSTHISCHLSEFWPSLNDPFHPKPRLCPFTQPTHLATST